MEEMFPHPTYIGIKDEQENSHSKLHEKSKPLDLHRVVERGGHNTILDIKRNVANAEVSEICAKQTKARSHMGKLPNRVKLTGFYQNPILHGK